MIDKQHQDISTLNTVTLLNSDMYETYNQLLKAKTLTDITYIP